MPAAFVTGASTGIGLACALRLHRDGWHVFAGVRRESDAEALAARAADRMIPVRCDVTDEASVVAAAETVAAGLGRQRLAGVVNNAGVAIGGPVEHLPLDYWRRQLEVNVVGQVAVTQAFLPLLREGWGRVVFVGSNSGLLATPMMAPYSASKFAIEALADSLRIELSDWDLPVSLIEPGAVRTAIWDKGRALADELEAVLPPIATERYGRWIAVIRKGIDEQDRTGVDPDVVARAVAHALQATRPRPRYLVGLDARLTAVVARLPVRLRDLVVLANVEHMV
jgi:NAD(P)-dependent dehydrogenase (short-subunit alcohol dehydrogenase family)